MTYQLTDSNKQTLLNLGARTDQIPFIEKAVNITKYTLDMDIAQNDHTQRERKTITAEQSIQLLGADGFLRAIFQSVYHFHAYSVVTAKTDDTAVRLVGISFDSTPIFK